ncbi:hypothetical protein CMV04_12280 [Elizabethkingia anophelis]|nr:hypothetical protein [Elizabethkingia anophelis]
MENARHEAIKAAYGEMWIYMSSFPQARNIALENEGWVFITQLPSTIDRSLFDFQHGDSICRPKSLSGIDNNRGWTRIESEEDLPKEPGHYFAIDIFRSEPCIIVFEQALKKNWLEVVSHYQPIEKPKPPIF